MQEIIKYYTTICEATGKNLQKENVSMHCWKWETQKKITPMNIKLKDEIIKQINVNISIKKLGGVKIIAWIGKMNMNILKIK